MDQFNLFIFKLAFENSRQFLRSRLEWRFTGADLGGGFKGCTPLSEMTNGFLIELLFCKKLWIIGVRYAIS